MDSELGDFFAEIEGLENQPNPEETLSHDIAPAIQPIQVIQPVQTISSAPVLSSHVVAASRAPEKCETKVVNEVFTYDQPEYQYPSEIPAISTTSSSNYTPSNPPQVFYQNKKFVRKGADEVWVDDSLKEWPDNDYRIFVGDLGKEVTTDMLTKQFQCFKSFAKAKVLRDKKDNKTKGYGFVSFLDPMDCIKAIREMNGKYLGTRPMTIKKSTWKDKDIKEVHKKEQKKRKFQESLGLA